MSLRLIFASTAALAMVAGTPAFAAKENQSEQASESSTGSPEAKEERKICKTFDATESRMKQTKLCLTREQWKKFDSDQ